MPKPSAVTVAGSPTALPTCPKLAAVAVAGSPTAAVTGSPTAAAIAGAAAAGKLRRNANKRRVFVALGVATSAVLLFALLGVSSVQVAAPNEWMVVVSSDGRMLRAGIGITHRPSLSEVLLGRQQVAKFPAALHKVPFRAMQVTREKQGVQVEGFAVWAVNRVGDGPFKAFSNLGGLTEGGIADANQLMADQAESIVRAQVAKMSIEDVISSREVIRDAVRGSMQKVVGGWGVWLETVEVTDVKVMSSTLFSNMQTKFREKMRREAELERITAQAAVDAARVTSKLDLDKAKAEANASVEVFAAQQALAAQQEREALNEERDALFRRDLAREAAKQQLQDEQDEQTRVRAHQFALEAAVREDDLQRKRDERDATRAAAAQAARLERARLDTEAELSALRAKLKLESGMSETNMRKAQLEALVEVYSKLPVRNVDVRSVFFAPDGSRGAATTAGGSEAEAGGGVSALSQILPGLAGLVEGVGGVSQPPSSSAAA